MITNENGNIEQILDYYPFGDIRLNEQDGSFDEKRKFTGHEHDSETDLEYMLARYQNPVIGKFLSIDPIYYTIGDSKKFDNIIDKNNSLKKEKTEEWLKKIKLSNNPKAEISSSREYSKDFKEYLANPQEHNSYSYAINNPLKYKDPNGKQVVESAAVLVPATILVLGLTAITVAVMSKPEIKWDPPGRQILPRLFNDKTPDEQNLLPDGMPPKLKLWKKIVAGAAIVGTVIKGVKETYDCWIQPSNANSD